MTKPRLSSYCATRPARIDKFNAAYEAALDEKPISALGPQGGLARQVDRGVLRLGRFPEPQAEIQEIIQVVLDPLSRQHGHRLVRDMGRENARKIIEGIGATKPGMANLTRNVIKRLFGYAIDWGWRMTTQYSKSRPTRSARGTLGQTSDSAPMRPNGH